MAYERREYKGAAPQTTLSADITNVATSIGVAAGTGYPDGSVGKFFIVIGAGTASEEKIFCSGRVGTTITATTRGADNTAAAAHVAGSTVDHVWTAYDANEANQHITDIAQDQHTQYLNVTRHDVTTRHAFGGALGVPSTPVDIGTAAAVGTAPGPGHSDHTHKIGIGAINVAAMIAAGTLTATQLAASSVGTSQLAALAVTTAKLALLSVDSTILAANAVTTAKIASGAVNTTQIANSAVDSAQIATAAVTAVKVSDGVLTQTKWANNDAYTAFSATATSGVTIGNGTVTGTMFQLGKLVIINVIMVFGTTTAITGAVSFTLAGISFKNFKSVAGSVQSFDDSAGVAYTSSCYAVAANQIRPRTGADGSTNFSATLPFTWANLDSVALTVVAELA